RRLMDVKRDVKLNELINEATFLLKAGSDDSYLIEQIEHHVRELEASPGKKEMTHPSDVTYLFEVEPVVFGARVSALAYYDSRSRDLAARRAYSELRSQYGLFGRLIRGRTEGLMTLDEKDEKDEKDDLEDLLNLIGLSLS
ncbi:MAG TPA: hypothetical protein VD770_05300, partial [Coxiellaceae bacterium]|nr:hypothetical protein [Coxiellaceae bacterium]